MPLDGGQKMRTQHTAALGAPGRLAGLTLGLVLLLAGCGEIGIPGSKGSSETAGSANGTDLDEKPDEIPDENEEPVEYAWGLPGSDTSVGEGHQGAEGSAYEALQRGCSEGAEFLDPAFAPEYGFESPRNVLLFAAGLRLCAGDRDAAASFFQHAEAYGTAGLTPDGWAFCDLYRTVRSVLEQRPPDEFECGAGGAPLFKSGAIATDDPLTLDVDESLAEPEPEPEPEPELEPEPEPEPEPDTEPAP
jgi:hypothetical protein